jgi:streptogramin lyase
MRSALYSRYAAVAREACAACAALSVSACAFGGAREFAAADARLNTQALRGPSVAAMSSAGSVLRPAMRDFAVRISQSRSFNDPRMLLQNSEIAVSDSQNGVVNIYLQKPPHTLVGQLTGFTEPQGMAVDAKGNLYVTNTQAGNVLVFAPGASSPYLTLDDARKLPVGVAVDTDGTVYVTNIRKADALNRPATRFTNGGTGIVVYHPGWTKPFKRLTDTSVSSYYFVAIGPNHRVYTSYFDANGAAQIGYYDPNDPQLHNLNLPNLQFPGGIKVDDGDILFDDQNARAILVFDPPHPHPRFFVPLIGAGDPVTFDYGRTEGTFWVADALGYAEHFSKSGNMFDAINVGGVPIGVVTLPQR